MKNIDIAIQTVFLLLQVILGVGVLIEISNNGNGNNWIESYMISLFFLGTYQLINAIVRIIKNLIVNRKISTNNLFTNYLRIVLGYFLLMMIGPTILQDGDWELTYSVYILVIPLIIAFYYYNYCYKTLKTNQ